MNKDSCDSTFDVCPACSADCADDLDAQAAAVKLQSGAVLIGRCECGVLFRAVPDVIWKTELIKEH